VTPWCLYWTAKYFLTFLFKHIYSILESYLAFFLWMGSGAIMPPCLPHLKDDPAKFKQVISGCWDNAILELVWGQMPPCPHAPWMTTMPLIFYLPNIIRLSSKMAEILHFFGGQMPPCTPPPPNDDPALSIMSARLPNISKLYSKTAEILQFLDWLYGVRHPLPPWPPCPQQYVSL